MNLFTIDLGGSSDQRCRLVLKAGAFELNLELPVRKRRMTRAEELASERAEALHGNIEPIEEV